MFSGSVSKDDLLSRFAKTRILVVGDVMLDRYWFGDTYRISPEAPVPVAKIERTENRAGGAANVARNIVSLGGQAVLLSVVGCDAAADDLTALMQQDGVDTHLLRDSSISTTIKLRVIARNQQLIRLDFEKSPTCEILRTAVDTFRELIATCDAVILSDYGKGGLTHVTEMIDIARNAGKMVLIDPKGNDYLRYRGATMITPNRTELREVVGDWKSEDELTYKVQQLRANLRLQSILLTRSEDGLSLFGEKIEHRPTQAIEVYDVSGAGDTVIAGMTLSLAANLSDSDAMTIANIAAGVVVGKVGTATCTWNELANVLFSKQ
ncbi:MAG: D-glycero-beta-D-manno-heptose-7-phosphate kinase [Neisseriaceae bacterium]|nr:D-glycero-beta-D-manno-heptose-7-phosphate kinase [Neisseriaceae bacterium]